MAVSEQQLQAAYAALGPIGADIQALTAGATFYGMITAAQAAALEAQYGWTAEQLAVALVPVAQMFAVTPISKYPVGAVAVGLTGALYYGANLEVSGEALSFTVHAEQAALANAWVNGEQGMSALAISAAPCGYCRQFLYELVDAATLDIAMPNQATQLLTYYLPDPFGPHDLGVQGGLMQAQANGLTVGQPLDAVGQAALDAANASYSPYTKTYAGVALMTASGVIATGRYAENAAFNPSMSPLEGALSQLVFYGQDFSTIVEAVLVETSGQASQAGATQLILGGVTSAPLTVVAAN